MRRGLVLALFALATCFATTATAQQLRFGTAGSMLLQGGVNYSYSGGETETNGIIADLNTTHTIMVGPEFGYFVIDGLHLGAVLQYLRRSSTNSNKDETISSNILAAFRPAYYIPLRPTRSLSLYFRGLIGYAGGGIESKPQGGGGSETTVGGFAGGAGAGVAFAFGGAWGGVIQLGLDYLYQGQSSETVGTTVSSDIRLHTVSFGTSLGLFF